MAQLRHADNRVIRPPCADPIVAGRYHADYYAVLSLRMSAAELSRQLGVPTNRVTGILNGQRSITGDTDFRLAHFFGTSPEFWLNLQSLYELRVAERRSGRAIDRLPTLKQQSRISA